MKDFLKKYWSIIYIIILAIFLIIIKQISVINIKSTYRALEFADDRLMINMAKSIEAGKYLGDYNYMTLAKGIGFPIFLALLNVLHLEYSYIFTLLYTLSIIYLIYSIKDYFKNKIILLIIFAIMLFNPITYDYNIIQRLYRNGLQIFLMIFIFAGYFILYSKRNTKKVFLLVHSIFLGIILTWFYISREDSAFLLPYVIVVSIILVISSIIENNSKKERILKIIINVIPIILVFIRSFNN